MTRLRIGNSKYGAVRQEEDGYKFDSTAERNRYRMLKLMERDGQIKHIVVHPAFDLLVNGEKVGRYVADFQYIARENGTWRDIVEDVKGVRTAVFRLKAKMMKALYGITIRECDQYGNLRPGKRRRKDSE